MGSKIIRKLPRWMVKEREPKVVRCRITVRVQPRAGRDEVVGFDDAHQLKIRVNAPPVDGKANLAVRELLSRLFGVPKKSVKVVTGAAMKAISKETVRR